MERKSFRQIMKKTHFSPNKISELKKEVFGIDVDPKHTQAYRLFHNENKRILDVALELGLVQEQAEKYYVEYLKMRGKDQLLSLFYANEEKIQPLLTLQEALNVEGISEEDYETLIAKIKYKEPPEWQKLVLDKEIKSLIAQESEIKSNIMKAQIMHANIERQCRKERETLQLLSREREELHRKNKEFKSRIERAIRGDTDPLLEAAREERFTFDRKRLSAFLEFFVPLALDTLQFDPAMTCSLSGTNYSPDDQYWFSDRLRSEGQIYIDAWLKDPTKWQRTNPDAFPLDI